MHRFRARDPDTKFEELLFLSAGVALTTQGLSSTRGADIADVIILTEYAVDGNGAQLTYRIFRFSAPDSELASIVLELPLDYDLDAKIAIAIESLLDMAGISGMSSPSAKIYGLFPETSSRSPAELAPVIEAPDGGPSVDIVAASVYAAERPREAASSMVLEDLPMAEQPTVILSPLASPPQASPPIEEPATRPYLKPTLEASASVAGTMFIGDAMEYFRYGTSGTLEFGLSWKRPRATLIIDARASIGRAFNDSGVVGGPLYISTAGLGLGVGSGSGKAYRAGVGLAGGAAFLTAAMASDTLTKTVPFSEIDGSIGIPLAERLFLDGELRFLVVFDGEMLVMGISPAITVGWEL